MADVNDAACQRRNTVPDDVDDADDADDAADDAYDAYDANDELLSGVGHALFYGEGFKTILSFIRVTCGKCSRWFVFSEET